MEEPRAYRLKRLKMRSMRRGIKDMDLILTAYAEAESEVALYDALLHENDQDLYQWVTGQADAPDQYSGMIKNIAQTFQK